MRSMSGMKPMSSMRSASSMTRISTPLHQELAALEMVEQAAGRGDQHVDAAVELLDLVVEGNAADEQRDGQLVVAAVAVEVLLDLGGEFARRLEDQRARHARPGAALLRAASASAGRKTRSCRCRSARCRARRGARARAGSPASWIGVGVGVAAGLDGGEDLRA